MTGKKIWIIATASVAAVAGALGIAMNTKQAKVKRFTKRVGKTMYTLGSVMCAVSGRQAARG